MTGVQVTSGLFLLLSLSTTRPATGSPGARSHATRPRPRPSVNIPGVDTSSLTPREKQEWSRLRAELLAPCSDVPVSIAQCVRRSATARKCVPAAKYIFKAVRDGMSQEQVEKSYHNRFDPDKVQERRRRQLPRRRDPWARPSRSSSSPTSSAPTAPCMAPVLEQTWQQRSHEIRFVYKFMPLSGHPHGETAARAAIAALDQGKFWEMHDKLFANRDHLEQSGPRQYAKEIGLDLNAVPRRHAVPGDDRPPRPPTASRPTSLGVQGTPTIYINGREFDIHQDLNEWIAQEMGEQASRSASAALQGNRQRESPNKP